MVHKTAPSFFDLGSPVSEVAGGPASTTRTCGKGLRNDALVHWLPVRTLKPVPRKSSRISEPGAVTTTFSVSTSRAEDECSYARYASDLYPAVVVMAALKSGSKVQAMFFIPTGLSGTGYRPPARDNAGAMRRPTGSVKRPDGESRCGSFHLPGIEAVRGVAPRQGA